MPMYRYSCPTCAAQRDILKPIADIDRTENCLHCGFAMNRLICAPAVRGDYEGYECPVSGKWIEGRVAHEENLKRTGCRVLEPGEREGMMRLKKESEETFLNQVAETTEAEVHAMPAEKRDKLVAEIEGGLDVSVTRSSPN